MKTKSERRGKDIGRKGGRDESTERAGEGRSEREAERERRGWGSTCRKRERERDGGVGERLSERD